MINPKISIIIPVYNAGQDIQVSLNSVFAQTLTDFEIIAVNDGSTDDSLQILRNAASRHTNLQVIDQTNHGQGYTRNRAIEQAKGDYLFFLDADDSLEPTAFETLYADAEQNKADIVHCGWRAGSMGAAPHRTAYYPHELFTVSLLAGPQGDELLRLHDYFCVNNLFRRDFIKNNNIRFGEGYIYEDNEFMVAAATRSSKVVFVDEPLYIINFHGESSTRGNNTTDKHYIDFLTALTHSFTALQPRTSDSKAYLANYMLEKFIVYYQQRVPKNYLKSYLHDFVDAMSKQHIELSRDAKVSKFLRLCIRLQIFERHRYILFSWCIFYKTMVIPLVRP